MSIQLAATFALTAFVGTLMFLHGLSVNLLERRPARCRNCGASPAGRAAALATTDPVRKEGAPDASASGAPDELRGAEAHSIFCPPYTDRA
jgi:hypothetical protein